MHINSDETNASCLSTDVKQSQTKEIVGFYSLGTSPFHNNLQRWAFCDDSHRNIQELPFDTINIAAKLLITTRMNKFLLQNQQQPFINCPTPLALFGLVVVKLFSFYCGDVCSGKPHVTEQQGLHSKLIVLYLVIFQCGGHLTSKMWEWFMQ